MYNFGKDNLKINFKHFFYRDIFRHLTKLYLSYQKPKIMQRITFNGNCPECNLTNKTVKMRVNMDHDLECPTCNLRVYHDNQKIAMIYRNRGKNEFALKQTSILTKQLLLTQSDSKTDKYSNGVLLTNNKSIQQYITQNPNNARISSIDILIQSYINSYIKDEKDENYKLISEFVGIDISQIKIQNRSGNKDTIQMFHYMHLAIEAYHHKSINILIKNKKLNTQITKYINKNLELIKNDIFLQQIALKNIIKNLINTIYSQNKVTI